MAKNPKNCPFCGSERPRMQTVGRRRTAMVCGDCGARGPEIAYERAAIGVAFEKALDAWNRRRTVLRPAAGGGFDGFPPTRGEDDPARVEHRGATYVADPDAPESSTVMIDPEDWKT